MKTRTWALAVAIVVALAAAVVAFWDAPDGSHDDADGRLEISMRDYRFEMSDWTVTAGEPVMIVLVNQDDVSHPLTFGKDLIIEDGRPADYTNELFAGLSPRVTPAAAVVQPSGTHEGFTVQVPGGETVTIEVTFPIDRVGTWGVGCFLGRGCHFTAGLDGTLRIVR
ncbi:MAG: hypothetical protein WD011_01670 [Nitriliruptoraceae bacterium]